MGGVVLRVCRFKDPGGLTITPAAMIAVTRLDGSAILLNEDLIETIEQTPDTVLSLVNGHKLMVRDHPEELVERVIEFRRVVAVSMRGQLVGVRK